MNVHTGNYWEHVVASFNYIRKYILNKIGRVQHKTYTHRPLTRVDEVLLHLARCLDPSEEASRSDGVKENGDVQVGTKANSS